MADVMLRQIFLRLYKSMTILSALLELLHVSNKMDGQMDSFILVATMQGSERTLKLTVINARRERKGSIRKVTMHSCSIMSGDSRLKGRREVFNRRFEQLLCTRN
jgi:hypothetical protein